MFILMISMASTLQAGEEPMGSGEPPAFQAAKGRVTYRTFCASCHGARGDGRGNVARYLKVEPTDLTRLTVEFGGEFPQERVRESIDGRSFVRGHGPRDMPVWGEVFQSPLADEASEMGAEERAECKICELVYYLETIQAPGEAREADE